MSFKAKIRSQDTEIVKSQDILVKYLKCPFIEDCLLMEKFSCFLLDFPDFLNCTEYQTKKKLLFQHVKEYTKIKSIK